MRNRKACGADILSGKTGSVNSEHRCAATTPSPSRRSLTEAAARLFDTLHTIDALPASLIHAERSPETGLGAAINDRLSRAGVRALDT
jgi:hypothetical protein